MLSVSEVFLEKLKWMSNIFLEMLLLYIMSMSRHLECDPLLAKSRNSGVWYIRWKTLFPALWNDGKLLTSPHQCWEYVILYIWKYLIVHSWVIPVFLLCSKSQNISSSNVRLLSFPYQAPLESFWTWLQSSSQLQVNYGEHYWLLLLDNSTQQRSRSSTHWVES